jgi:hypothetical protein
MSITARLLVMATLLAGCSPGPEESLWSCQLEVQKGNAGRDEQAKAERDHDITACMDNRGFHLDVAKPACQTGSVDHTCYRTR